MTSRPAFGKTRAQLRPALSVGERLYHRRGWSNAHGGNHTRTTSSSFVPCWMGAQAWSDITFKTVHRQSRSGPPCGCSGRDTCSLLRHRNPPALGDDTRRRCRLATGLCLEKQSMVRGGSRIIKWAERFPNRSRSPADDLAPGIYCSHSCPHPVSHSADACSLRPFRRWFLA
jgi:hypothetical protein